MTVGGIRDHTRDERHRAQMTNVNAPFWDGNETWLVLVGAALCSAFPQSYAILLPAFYLPLLLLLFALVFRGVAFEVKWRWPWLGKLDCSAGRATRREPEAREGRARRQRPWGHKKRDLNIRHRLVPAPADDAFWNATTNGDELCFA